MHARTRQKQFRAMGITADLSVVLERMRQEGRSDTLAYKSVLRRYHRVAEMVNRICDQLERREAA